MQTHDKKLSRREFFERAMILGVAAAGVSALAACNPPKRGGAAPEGEKKADAPAPADPVCDDQAGVDEATQKNRDTFKYVTKATDPAKPCDTCQLYKIGSPCGTCTVVKGPIAPKGGCTAWAPKAT